MEKSSSSSSSFNLTTEELKQALVEYCNYEKPNPLQRQQLESWSLVWKEEEEVNNDDDNQQRAKKKQWIEIRTEYIQLYLWLSRIECCQTTTGYDFDLQIDVSAKLLLLQTANKTTTTDNINKKQMKIREKIRRKMLERFKRDEIISYILGEEKKFLLGAKIKIQNTNHFEERTWIDIKVLKAIQQCIYSTSFTSNNNNNNNEDDEEEQQDDENDGLLSVLEVILALLCLQQKIPHKLGHRAKLRLLEDAMSEACQQEQIKEEQEQEQQVQNISRMDIKDDKEKKKKKSKEKSNHFNNKRAKAS